MWSRRTVIELAFSRTLKWSDFQTQRFWMTTCGRCHAGELGTNQITCDGEREYGDSNGKWHVVIFDANSGQPSLRPRNDHTLGVTVIARDPFKEGRWASADGEGRIYVWNSIDDGIQHPSISGSMQSRRQKSADLQFGPNDQLLVSTGIEHDRAVNLRVQQSWSCLVCLMQSVARLVVRDATDLEPPNQRTHVRSVGMATLSPAVTATPTISGCIALDPRG